MTVKVTYSCDFCGRSYPKDSELGRKTSYLRLVSDQYPTCKAWDHVCPYCQDAVNTALDELSKKRRHYADAD
jgi:hypothetical protein